MMVQSVHIQIPPDRLPQYRCGYYKSEYHWGYSAAIACAVASVTVESEYPHSTLNGTPIFKEAQQYCIYVTYIASGRNLDVYQNYWKPTKIYHLGNICGFLVLKLII